MTDLSSPKPKADVLSVEDLVAKLKAGEIRIPYFQRSLRWSEKDNVDLFDSIYKGYPIGTLLMWKKVADEEIIEIGPITIYGKSNPGAWWVIDGQQRLTALGAAALLETPQNNHNDKYFVYFNPQNQTFTTEKSVKNRSNLVPLNKMIDSAELMNWIFDSRIGQDHALRKIVLEASKRIREYKIPIYIITSENDYAPRVIFNRLNNMGKSMKVTEVFDALLGKKDDTPGRLDELSTVLEEEIKWGTIKDNVLLQASLAIKGKNVTQKFNTLNESELKDFNDIYPELHNAFEKTIYFLIKEANIPHIKLLPYITPLIVLPRFFHFHPSPNKRTLTLLRRWVWRGMLSGEHAPQERAFLRSFVKVINPNLDEELNAYNLLNIVTHDPVLPPSPTDNYNLNSAKTKILLLMLSVNSPRDFITGDKLELNELLTNHNSKSVQNVLSSSQNTIKYKTIANKLFQAPNINIIKNLKNCNNKDIIDSHLISPYCLELFLKSEYNDFIYTRSQLISDFSLIYSKNMSEWNANDRPSISFILSGQT